MHEVRQVWCRVRRRTRRVVALIAIGGALVGSGPPAEPPGGAPAAAVPESPELLALGQQAFRAQCAVCHGETGRGDGRAAYLLNPKPRDFVAARYRIASTWEQVPTDEDLFGVISRGMPGSAMPSWAHLPERTRWGLVYYLKSLAAKPLTVAPTTPPAGEGEGGRGLIPVPPEPPYTARERDRAAYLFREACASCHGPEGRGDGAEKQVTSEGYPTRPRDLTRGVYKSGGSPAALYRRIVAGMAGTPMPGNDWAYGADAWHLVHYVRELAHGRVAPAVQASEIVARRVAALPAAPADPGWSAAEPVRIGLMPLWWRDDRVEAVQLWALHDGERLAVKLAWADATPNDDVVPQDAFTDGAAVQITAAPAPPTFAMGAADTAVNIWHWTAVADRNRGSNPATLRAAFPRLVPPIAGAAPAGDAFWTARAVGNPLAALRPVSAVQEANARGFGTLTPQPPAAQNVAGTARRTANGWEVVFVRALASADDADVPLRPGERVSIAVAVWDGAAKDRNGQKSVSIWQGLTVGK